MLYALAQSVHNGKLAAQWSCRPGEDAARLFGFHAQSHQARGLVFSLGALDGVRAEAPWEAVERVEAVDARMVRRMVVVRMSRGRRHSHEALQVPVGVGVRTHAGRRDGVGSQDAARARASAASRGRSRPQVALHLHSEEFWIGPFRLRKTLEGNLLPRLHQHEISANVELKFK